MPDRIHYLKFYQSHFSGLKKKKKIYFYSLSEILPLESHFLEAFSFSRTVSLNAKCPGIRSVLKWLSYKKLMSLSRRVQEWRGLEGGERRGIRGESVGRVLKSLQFADGCP